MKKGTVENPSQRRMKKTRSYKRSEEEMSEEGMMQEEYQLEYSPEKEEIIPINNQYFMIKSLNLPCHTIGNRFKQRSS
jgi:hypothetical protein